MAKFKEDIELALIQYIETDLKRIENSLSAYSNRKTRYRAIIRYNKNRLDQTYNDINQE